MKINSAAAMKRVLKLAGLVIRVRNHWQPQLVGTTRTPKAIRNGGKSGIQTNGYWFDGPNHDGKTVEMWASIPPLRNCDSTMTAPSPSIPTPTGHGRWNLQHRETE